MKNDAHLTSRKTARLFPIQIQRVASPESSFASHDFFPGLQFDTRNH